MKLILAGTIENISTRNDNSVVVKFGSQEINSEDAGKLFQFRNTYCKLLISNDNITKLTEELVVNESVAEVKGNKSPSKRLRSVLYLIHEQEKMSMPFDDYYNTELNKIIEHYKTKLQ